MKRMAAALFLFFSATAWAQPNSGKPYQEDFEYFWTTIHDNYCYFNKKKTDWNAVKATFSPLMDTVQSRNGFITLIEDVFYTLYDHHCSLNTNTPYSRRLVPTGADLWAEYIGGKPVITEVRPGLGAEKTGMRVGMEVVRVNDVPIEHAILPYLSAPEDPQAKSFALRLVLAGDHLTPRKITVRENKKLMDFYPDHAGMMLEHIAYPSLVESKQWGDIAYIRINNCLYDNQVIHEFDSVLDQYRNSRALILDLRETPSGGNSSVARAILSRFITKEQFYQKHELYAEEKETGIRRSWAEIVTPRGVTYTHPLAVLADHWTGSMGEGITIGFDGMERATVIGTELARLNGATETFEMPNTKIRFSFPTERLYHVGGQPRELYEPKVIVDMLATRSDPDLILSRAISELKEKIK